MSKKIAILLALVFIAMPSFAKGLKIEKHYKLMPDKVADAYHPVISSDGSKILFTSDDYLGLKLLNLKNGNITGISEEIGSGILLFFLITTTVFTTKLMLWRIVCV